MASVIQIGNKARGQVRSKNHPTLTKTFPNKHTPCKNIEEATIAAWAWCYAQEADISAGKKIGLQGKAGVTVGQAIDRYLDVRKDISHTAVYALYRVKKALGHIALNKLTDDDIFNFIEKQNVSPIGGHTLFSPLCSVLKKARVGWKYQVQDIVKSASERLIENNLIGPSGERTRRPTAEEIKKLVAYEINSKVPMADVIEFAIATAMRVAEITRITWETYSKEDRTVVITQRKHPKKKLTNNQEVPLLSAAIEIIERQKKEEFDNRIFPFEPRTISALFRKMCRDLEIKDLHFHDLRHEGTTRLFEMGYQPHVVKMFTGHESTKMLERYTHLNAKDVSRVEKKALPSSESSIEMDPETMKEFAEFKRFKAMQKMMETGM